MSRSMENIALSFQLRKRSSVVGSVPTYTLFSCSMRLAETDVTSLLNMTFFSLSQLCPPSSLFHSPSPNVPQYTRFGFRGSNVTDCGWLPFRDSRLFQPVFDDSINRSESCIAAKILVI